MEHGVRGRRARLLSEDRPWTILTVKLGEHRLYRDSGPPVSSHTAAVKSRDVVYDVVV